jgi:hypothetical protein
MPAIIIGSVPIPIPGIPDRKIHFNHILILQVIPSQTFREIHLHTGGTYFGHGVQGGAPLGRLARFFCPLLLAETCSRRAQRSLFFIYLFYF